MPGPLMVVRTAALCLAVLLVSSGADARSTHVVRHGQTLGGIALEYRTTVRDLIAANPRLKNKALRSGQTIVIPGHDEVDVRRPGSAKTSPEKPSRWSGKPKHPGVVHLTRLASMEDAITTVRDRAGRVPKGALPVFGRMLRAKSGAVHGIDARLVALVGVVSDHFAGRRLEVVSGYRPYSPKQHTPHSNHNVGHAMDFRVVGVPNEVVRDYCRTLRNVGVGYYPNSVFVHLDVRNEPAYWVDFSKPGEAPRYGEGGVDPDEGASDVSDDFPLVNRLVNETARDEDETKSAPKAEPAPSAEAPAPRGVAPSAGESGPTAEEPSN